MANDKIDQIIIIDNGAHTMKVGFHTDTTPRLIPNCITKVKNEKRRPFIGDQMDECKDYSGMFYIQPFNRGYLLNWDIQRQIWDYVFRNVLRLQSDNKNRYENIGILITEPVYNFSEIRQTMLRILFDEYGFGKVMIISAAELAAFNYYINNNKMKKNKPPCCLVVDSGYSFTHIIPIVDGYKLLSHTKRINIGGKALTNHLKEILSYRQINVLDETYVVNQLKEDCCFVSMDFWHDLELASNKNKDNSIVRDYILPDYIVYKRGFVYDHEKHVDLNKSDYQLIRMNNERFQVPELLFHPSDINMDQIGLVETIVYSLNEFNPTFRLISKNDGDLIDNNNNNNNSNETTTTLNKRDNLKDIDSDDYEEEEEEEDDDDDDDDDDDEEDQNYQNNDKNDNDNNNNNNNNDKKKKEENCPRNGLRSVKQSRLSSTTNGSNEQQQQQQSTDNLYIYDDENIRERLYGNILLIGGNCRFSNFRNRIYNDLRGYVPDLIDIDVIEPSNPINYAWEGGRILCHYSNKSNKNRNEKNFFQQFAVSRQQYQQLGLNYCLEKLMNYRLIDNDDIDDDY